MALEQDRSLLPEEKKVQPQTSAKLDGLMKGFGAALQQKVAVNRDALEFQASLKDLEGKSDAEKILLLKLSSRLSKHAAL